MKNPERTFFVKSMEPDFTTKTVVGEKKVDCQSLDDMLSTRCIKPNTRSFGQEPRLSTTVLHDRYTKTYRPQGIIFETKESPSYVSPFDLVVLTNAEKLVVQYNRIKDQLDVYYGHHLLKGAEDFFFPDLPSLLETYPTHESVLQALNEFRTSHGFTPLSPEKKKLTQYNEAVFHRPVAIQPTALFGYTQTARDTAKRVGLPIFRSAKAFYESQADEDKI